MGPEDWVKDVIVDREDEIENETFWHQRREPRRMAGASQETGIPSISAPESRSTSLCKLDAETVMWLDRSSLGDIQSLPVRMAYNNSSEFSPADIWVNVHALPNNRLSLLF